MKVSATQAKPFRHNTGLLAALVLGTAALFQVLIPAQWAFRCMFHHWTGLPCPTCGATRCLRLILDGRWIAAWQLQPLVFSTVFILGALVVYSALASFFKWPVLRIHFESRSERGIAVMLAAALLIGNWMYLMLNGGV